MTKVKIMSDFETHKRNYEMFRKDAENESLFEGTRVEVYFLGAFHLIEACAARKRIHINKHQKIRSVLESSDFIFGDNTGRVWRSFQKMENQLRPKFAYGASWNKNDFDELKNAFKQIEEICLKALENA
jgi:hypothetical protein